METTFYEDSARYRGREESARGVMKRPMTLDLGGGVSKKPRGVTALLTSPDLNMLKLGSPELEKLIMAQHGLMGVAAPAPQQPPPSQCMYPKSDDRDPYARDFPEALSAAAAAPYHQAAVQSDLNISAVAGGLLPPSAGLPPCSMDSFGYPQQQPLSASSLGCGGPMGGYAGLGGGYYNLEPIVSIKEEPQTVPCMGGGLPSSPPPRSPIDLEDQERLKLERKRLRNRIAASKCRRRKLERIARLEDKVAHLKSENSELSGHVSRLREHVCQLKQQVMDHVRSGCEILMSAYPAFPEDL